jgi:hypothetical protein
MCSKKIRHLKEEMSLYKDFMIFTEGEEISDKEVKASYIMLSFNITTYDTDIDLELFDILIEIMEAILKQKTLEYINISKQNYRNFILFVNIIKEYIDWGTSIRTCFFTKLLIENMSDGSYIEFEEYNEIKELIDYLKENNI